MAPLKVQASTILAVFREPMHFAPVETSTIDREVDHTRWYRVLEETASASLKIHRAPLPPLAAWNRPWRVGNGSPLLQRVSPNSAAATPARTARAAADQ